MKRLLNSRAVDERQNAEQSTHKINIPFQYLQGFTVTTSAWILETPVDYEESHVRRNPATNFSAVLRRHGNFSLTSRTRYS